MLIYGFIINAPVFVVFLLFLLISLCLLYPLRYKRNSLLLLIDIAFSIIYAFGFNYIIYIFGLDIFRSPFLFIIVLFYVVILGIILLIAKILKLVLRLDIASFLKKIFMHGIIILFLTALFTISFLYVARLISHSTNCDINLLSYNNKEWKMCIQERAKLQSEPYLCDRLDESLKKDVALCQWVQSGFCNNNFVKKRVPTCEWFQVQDQNYCDKSYKEDFQDIISCKLAAGVK